MLDYRTNKMRPRHSTVEDDAQSLSSQKTLDLEDFDLQTPGSSAASAILYLGGGPLERMAPRHTSFEHTFPVHVDGSYGHEEEYGYEYGDDIDGQTWEDGAEIPFGPSQGWDHVLGILEAPLHDHRPSHTVSATSELRRRFSDTSLTLGDFIDYLVLVQRWR